MTKVAFRVDASLKIATGHVMRCLTLAGALREKGMDVVFISRAHEGNMNDFIREKSFPVEVLAAKPGINAISPPHAAWLECGWQEDAAETAEVLERISPDLLVVDHYAIEGAWEKAMRPFCRRIMVIDELCDRLHDCDLLLDTYYGHTTRHHEGMIPQDCQVLAGTEYVLLRPEFADLRVESLSRRNSVQGVGNILISMGGMDNDNITGKILESIPYDSLQDNCRITVVMGSRAPWLDQVKTQAQKLSRSVDVLVDARNMGRLMIESDVAIGGGGQTSFERCCLGLPTMMGCMAENQSDNIASFEKAGLAYNLGDLRGKAKDELAGKMKEFLTDATLQRDMSRKAAEICDGKGTERVVAKILELLR